MTKTVRVLRLPEVKRPWDGPKGIGITSGAPGMRPAFQFDPLKFSCSGLWELSLAERGLLLSAVVECLMNDGTVPDDASLMKILAVPKADFKKAMTERVRAFFLESSAQ
jgi:hypothetical protein